MQSEDQTLFDPDYRNGRHRNPDWVTSVAAAADVAYRAGSQKARLLEAFKDAYPVTLTDEEAAERAGISLTSEYSKRCGELRQDGAIVVVRLQNGQPLTRAGKSGIQRIVSIYDRERGA